MVNRKEGLFVEKPFHDDKKEPKRDPLRWAAREERAVRAKAAPTGHKKPDGRTRMVRSVRNSFRQ